MTPLRTTWSINRRSFITAEASSVPMIACTANTASVATKNGSISCVNLQAEEVRVLVKMRDNEFDRRMKEALTKCEERGVDS
ncbi:hypothetical protein FOWG_02861 [Fusarium oxysporum f. sp. lycopersici MN25]|nr:hypothetical protein FOWG_02861 [Fusarium oxysporum f. sp. lycopersici MN25]